MYVNNKIYKKRQCCVCSMKKANGVVVKSMIKSDAIVVYSMKKEDIGVFCKKTQTALSEKAMTK